MRLRDRVEPVVLALVTLGVVALAIARGSDGVTVLTAALVLLTAYYAFQTRAMVNQSREEHREAVTKRDWDREEAAARRLLTQFDAALTVSARGGALLLHDQPDIVVHLVDALGDHAFELNDQELQRRMNVCLMAGQTVTWPEQHLQDPRASTYLMFELIQETRRSLQAYVRRRTLPEWPDRFPQVAEAQQWISAPATTSPD